MTKAVDLCLTCESLAYDSECWGFYCDITKASECPYEGQEE